jgi:L-fuculose-phosphate aldolase
MGVLKECSQLAEELSLYSRLCYDRRLVGAAGGNISVRVPGREMALITATGVSLRDVRPTNLLLMDLEGTILENPAGLRPSKEAAFHLGIYRIRPAVQAIVHVHPTYSTLFSIARKPIPLVTVSAVNKLRQGSLVGEAPGGSTDLKERVLCAVQASPSDATVFLMERHGLTAVGSTLCQAFDDAELAEDTAKIAIVLAVGSPALA